MTSFVPDAIEPFENEPTLLGLSFAVKDVFDVAGMVTGFGHPRWAATHEPANRTARVVESLTNEGAVLAGKTVCDELAFGLTGENPTYGTPVNPRAPARIPGGSSSGSASVTASRLVDFALGTDTGGSVRIPAAYCGIYGFRPTHGRVSSEGCLPLAPSFDTVGWLTRSAGLLQELSIVLLDAPASRSLPDRLLVATDALELSDAAVVEALRPRMDELAAVVGSAREVRVSEGRGLAALVETFRVMQGYEVWRAHGEWIESEDPALAVDVAARVRSTREIGACDYRRARRARRATARRLDELLGDDAVLVLPTAPELAPRRDRPRDDETKLRARTLSLSTIAVLGGLPQVSIPAALVDGAPAGLSLIGPRGSDEALLVLAEVLEPR